VINRRERCPAPAAATLTGGQAVKQEPLFLRRELKSPAALLFYAAFASAALAAGRSEPAQAAIYVALSAGIVLLCWLAVGLTERTPLPQIRVERPWSELAFACIVFLAFEYGHFPRISVGSGWLLPSIVYKGIWLFAIPCAFLLLRRHGPASLGFSRRGLARNLGLGGIIFACMAIPSAFFVSDTGHGLLSGEIAPAAAATGFVSLFFRNVALAGFPEEFFFRAYVQTRVGVVLRSRLAGLLLVSLFFGMIHVEDLTRAYPGLSWTDAFARAFFLQGFLGLVLGVLWERTRSLVPGVFLHSAVNALNNLAPASLCAP